MGLRHAFKASGILAILLFILLAVNAGMDRKILPGWKEILTRPIAEWESDAAKKRGDSARAAAVPAPSVREEKPPPRFSGRPPERPPSKENARGHESETRPSLEREKMTSMTRAENARAKYPDERPAQGLTERELEELLARAGELVRNGARAPRLIARWTLEDIETLVARGYGIVAAELGGAYYWAAPEGGSFLDADEFLALTREKRAGISNRGLPLNLDPSLGPRLRGIERRLLARRGKSTGERPVFLFFPSVAFDAYLARKQLLALNGVGLDAQRSGRTDGAFATVGDIALTASLPVYVIREVRVGGDAFPWEDPERGD